MASFRNILVHDYVKINRSMVYRIIIDDLFRADPLPLGRCTHVIKMIEFS
ncbi:HepT-like ribonuclease domain-containing protein [Candidatus Contubernalis alkaliaceticus]